MTHHLGRCTLQTDERVLRCGEQVVPLPPKAVELLAVLAERSGEVVSKEVLMNGVWGDGAVEEANLTQSIYRLRRALKEREPSVRIETIPRRGYRLVNSANGTGGAPSTPIRRRRMPLVAGAALAGGLVLAGVLAWSRMQAGSLEVPPSYALGYFYWSTAKNAAAVRTSITYFNRAIAEVPRSPLGYAGLADAHLSLSLREIGTPQMVADVRSAFVAARRAVALGPLSSDAHAAYGQAEALFGDPNVAERELRRAVALDPTSVEARTWYGELLLDEARSDDAAAQFRAALADNSSWTEAGDDLALLAYLRRDFPKAAAYAKQSLAQSPSDRSAMFVLALANGRLDRPRAESELRTLARRSAPGGEIGVDALLSYYYIQDRRTALAHAEYVRVQHATQRTGVVNDPGAIVSIAAVLAAQHQDDAAFAWLDRMDPASRRLYAEDARLDLLRRNRRFHSWIADV